MRCRQGTLFVPAETSLLRCPGTDREASRVMAILMMRMPFTPRCANAGDACGCTLKPHGRREPGASRVQESRSSPSVRESGDPALPESLLSVRVLV